MHQRAIGPEDCAPIDIHLIPRWEESRQFLVSRRSVRVYINEPREKEKVSKVARLGTWPVNFQVAAVPTVASPEGGASWRFRFMAILLFPR